MKTLGNKFFIFGVLFLLLISIPLTVFILKTRVMETRSRAEATSTLIFNPTTKSATVGQDFTVDIMLDPGKNMVGTVKVSLTFDPTKLSIEGADKIQPSAAFPVQPQNPTISSGSATFTVDTGGNATQAIQTITKVATISFKPLEATNGQPTFISFDPSQTKAFSLNTSIDAPSENVLLQPSSKVAVTIGGEVAPTATPTPTGIPTDTPIPTPTATPTGTASATNASPICTELSASPGSSGSAPFSVMLTGRGQDSDGTISKATFNFGDGQAQDVTDGLGQQTVAAQISHVYQSTGNFSATVTFTDDQNAISASCTQVIQVNGSAVATATPVPTVAPTGDAKTTIGIIGGIMLTILGGLFLLAL